VRWHLYLRSYYGLPKELVFFRAFSFSDIVGRLLYPRWTFVCLAEKNRLRLFRLSDTGMLPSRHASRDVTSRCVTPIARTTLVRQDVVLRGTIDSATAPPFTIACCALICGLCTYRATPAALSGAVITPLFFAPNTYLATYLRRFPRIVWRERDGYAGYCG
jgi:hypothetical protein